MAKKNDPGRDTNHDELVNILIKRRLDVVRACGFAGFGSQARRGQIVEWPIGKGFVDFAVLWRRRIARLALAQSNVSPGDLDGKEQATAILVEVKSEREHWAAGDVIRQQKNHRKSFLERYPNHGGNFNRQLWTDGQGVYVWPVLAFFCPRALSETEANLFRHERFVVLPHEWSAPSLALVGGDR